MNKYIYATVFGTALALNSSMFAIAQQVPAIKETSIKQTGYVSRSVPMLPFLSDDTIKLDTKQQRGVSLADQWKNKTTLPFMGEDGSVQYIYGETLPSIVCAPLYACDVALQSGEIIRQIMLGDASRWKVSPGTSGSGENTIAHIIIKPSDIGLSTNLVIHTDRRSYNIRLVSKKDLWMPIVSFVYPDDTQAQWAAYQDHQKQLKAPSPSVTSLTTSDLNFNYKIRGASPLWKPIRVYSDKAKTYIQFPATVKYDQTPALVILDASNQEQLVNYRMVDDRYVVDQVIKKAALVQGVGRHQQRIEIAREGS